MNKPIAYGRTAEIYDWGEGQILKLYYDWVNPNYIKHEQKIGKAIQSTGMKAPVVGDIVEVNGRTGLVYQKISGVDMLVLLRRKPWNVFRFARLSAELHAEMHSIRMENGLPDTHARLKRKINNAPALPERRKQELVAELDALPRGSRLVHGDFHPGNIMVTDSGAMVIDWIDAGIGNPAADVARSAIILYGAVNSNQLPELATKSIFSLFFKTYLKHYFRLHPEIQEEYPRWMAINAAARLDENISEIEDWLLKRADQS